MTNDEMIDRLLNAERRIKSLEDAAHAHGIYVHAPSDFCDGTHLGHPCQDPECWVLVRHKEQQEGQ